MNCEQCQENLSAFMDGELVEGLQTEIDEHLQNCSGCRAEWDELHRLDARLQSLTLPANGAANAFAVASQQSLAVRQSRPAGLRWMLPWILAIAACLAIMFFVTDSRPTPAVPIAGRLVHATGAVEVQLQGTEQWTALEKSGAAIQRGCHVRTSPNSLCEIETSEKATLRMGEIAEVVLHDGDRIEVIRGQVWCRAPESKSIQVDTCFPIETNFQLISMTCPSDSEFQWTVDQNVASCQSISSEQTEWSNQIFSCPVGPGERVTVDGANNLQRSREDSLAKKLWQLPLLAASQASDEELTSVLEPLLIKIGSTKAGFMDESAIRNLGPAGAIPLLAYVQSDRSHGQPSARARAMRIAVEIADETAIPRLRELSHSANPGREIASLAEEALRRLE
jgi:Putative zinc-finger